MKSIFTVTDTGDSRITIITDDGEVHNLAESHPHFGQIAARLINHEDPTDLLDVAAAVERLDDRVEIRDGVLHFDGEPLHDGVAATIIRYHAEGRDTANLVKFMENLAENPSYNSREQLFTWINARSLVIDDDGYIVSYKGVREDGTSVNAGTAFVNGVEHTGHIPNKVGDVVSMPRAQVNDNPNEGCSSGLHIGDFNYASGWGSRLMEVRINPRDVVSIPSDSGYAKMRCCQYEVLAIHEVPEDDLSWYEPEATWDEGEADAVLGQAIPHGFWASLKARIGLAG